MTASISSDSFFPPSRVVNVSETVRNSERHAAKPKKLDDYHLYMCVKSSDLCCDPVTVQEALCRADSHEWKKAMAEEMKSFEAHRAWELVNIPEKGSVVGCKWVFKRKCDSENKSVSEQD